MTEPCFQSKYENPRENSLNRLFAKYGFFSDPLEGKIFLLAQVSSERKSQSIMPIRYQSVSVYQYYSINQYVENIKTGEGKKYSFEFLDSLTLEG